MGSFMENYFKNSKSFSLLLFLVTILLFGNSKNNVSLPIIMISNQAQATTYSLSSSRSSLGSATITNIQLPGIIPNNNPSPPPAASSPPTSTGNINTATANPASNNPNAPPPP